MKEIQKLLVCVDLSDYSHSTMEYGVALSRGLLTEIVVLNVINIREVEAIRTVSGYYPHKIDAEECIHNMENNRREQMQRMIDTHFPADAGKIHLVVETGVPFRVILQKIVEEGIDLVVIGKKGRSNVVGTMLGSNAEKIFRHSSVPVLSVIHTKQRAKRPYASHALEA